MANAAAVPNQGLHFRSATMRFGILGACLFLLSLLFFHSDWPPLEWQHIRVATPDIGKSEILPISILFFAVALIHFSFPRVFRRRLNERLTAIHFWTNVAFLPFAVIAPILVNLTLRPSPGEPKFDSVVRRFGTAMEFSLWELVILMAIQLFLVANMAWSIAKGERTPE